VKPHERREMWIFYALACGIFCFVIAMGLFGG